MRRIKLVFAAIAAFTGIGGAIASSNVHGSKPSMVHDWVDLNNNTVFLNLTTSQAQMFCYSSFTICLKAKDNFNVTTRGTLQ